MNEAGSPDKPKFTELDAILLDIARMYYCEGSLDGSWEENRDSLLPYKEKIKDLYLKIIGEDVDAKDIGHDYHQASSENGLRAELRDEVNEL